MPHCLYINACQKGRVGSENVSKKDTMAIARTPAKNNSNYGCNTALGRRHIEHIHAHREPIYLTQTLRFIFIFIIMIMIYDYDFF